LPIYILYVICIICIIRKIAAPLLFFSWKLLDYVFLEGQVMLVSLEIEDFGLIDRLCLEGTPGLNVLSGETGAGKSIIIDALQVVLGHRASVDFIRAGREKARITAVFDLNGNTYLKEKLAGWGLPLEEDEMLFMFRELNRSGRGTCRLNSQAVALSIYREAGRYLVALQGQHEQQHLLNPAHQLNLLDRFGGDATCVLQKRIRELYESWGKAKKNLDGLLDDTQDRTRRLDILRYQIDEIEKAGLAGEEDKELVKERLRLANAEKILALAGECHRFLQGGEGGACNALDCLGQVRRGLTELARLDEHLAHFLATVENAFYQLEDIARELASYIGKIQSDPERLQFVEDRLTLLKSLKKKYGDTVAEILRYKEQAVAQCVELTGWEESAAALEQEVAHAGEEWQKTAVELTAERLNAARRLEEAVTRELISLEMKQVKFSVQFKQTQGISPHGQETIEFLISPNPGEPLKPLAKIASGGELSRIMLAIGAILAYLDEIPTLVFDEVDTGIGGKTLQAVAEKLSRLSTRKQVICVTHAAQVASFADNHYFIHKDIAEDRTIVRTSLLGGVARIKEIARLLSGTEDALAQEHAQQLLDQAKVFKEIL